jgi:phosphate-selective porin OprO/OprP
VNKLFKLSAMALAVSAFVSTAAYADQAETKGGVTVKTDDGRFKASVGGRIHFDGNLVKEDAGSFAGGSNSKPAQSGFYFRRIYLTLSGKLYGWSYKIEPDFAPNNASGATGIAFQDVYLATDLGPGEIQIGQRKPFRAMEDLTSSNDVLMIERPFASSSGGLFKGGSGAPGVGDREFQDGLFYHGNGDNYTWGVSATSLRRDNSPGTEGWATSGRGTFTPINSEGSIVHLGLNASFEKPANIQDSAAPMTIGAGGFAYAGRRGPGFNLASSRRPVTTIGLEYANVFGPFFAQAEFYNQRLQADKIYGGANVAAQTVQAFYVQGSYFVTGESKPYKKADGVFSNPKPKNDFGAVELTARYDSAKNKDISASNLGVAGNCAVGADKCEIRTITVGANYYLNPNVRFMLNYVIGKADEGVLGTDQPKTLAARFQLAF